MKEVDESVPGRGNSRLQGPTVGACMTLVGRIEEDE